MRVEKAPLAISRAATAWIAAGWFGVAGLPWLGVEGGFFTASSLSAFPWGADVAPALVQAGRGQRWLLPLLAPLLFALPLIDARRLERQGTWILACGAAGLLYLAVLGLAAGMDGWNWPFFDTLFGPLPRRQPGFGWGAALYALAMLMLLCRGLAARGWMGGDFFVLSLIAFVMALIALFIAYPLVEIMTSALRTPRGIWAPELFVRRLFAPRLWEWGGVVWNTLLLGAATAAASTALATAFALVATRTRLKGNPLLGLLSVLPIITPPFVIGLAVILLFGRSGAVNAALEALFGIVPSRWIYGFQGVWFAQTLAFAPIAYLVMIGVVQGASPTLEEAAETLRASQNKVFLTITLPLMRPGIANAFLVTFIESLSDFGNPLVLGGDFSVLATAIYFAVVGARQDRGLAAVLGLLLLAFMIAVFCLQRWALAGKVYTTIGGKAEQGHHPGLSPILSGLCLALALPWAALTATVYGMIFFGGFVENWGLKNVFTLKHYLTAFSIDLSAHGIAMTGVAWPSLSTTVMLAGVAAPLSSALALAIAWLIARQRFILKSAFEAATMFASAIPGTVIGIAYILAFNVPPIELTYTAAIIVLSYVFRNLGTSVRAGVASLAQIDRSLDEASLTLRAGSFRTLRSVIMPLLRPAIAAALIYGFVRAMTSVSAVIFLASPDYMLSTVYIVNRAESGDYGIAIAYSSVLILIMLAAVGLIRIAVGRRVLRRAAIPRTATA